MHEVLLLGIAASELTVLLTSDPRRWSRRLSLFLTLLLAVICYSWFVLGVSTVANAIGATLAVVWFAWDLIDPSARGVLARWALASVGCVALLSLDPLDFPLLSLRSGRPIDLIIAVLFLVTGPVNHLIRRFCSARAAVPPILCPGGSTLPFFRRCRWWTRKVAKTKRRSPRNPKSSPVHYLSWARRRRKRM